MTETYKTKNELSSSFMQEIFRENTTHYNLRNNDPSDPSAMGQKVSDLKIHNYGKRYHQQYGIQKPFVNLKINFKTGTAKTARTNYAAYLFLIWAIYDF